MVINFILFLIFNSISANVSVDAEIDKDLVRLGSTFTYTISVQTKSNIQNAGDLTLTELDKDFEVISQYQSQGFSSTYVNGRFESSTTTYYKYVLSPKSLGKKTIPAIEVIVDGKTYKTPSFEVQVIDSYSKYKPRSKSGSQTPGGGQNVPNIRQNTSGITYFSVKAIPDKTDVYLGEQIIVSFYLYSKVSIDNPDIYKRPQFSGFIKEDLETVTRLNFTNKIINGQSFKVALLAKYAIYPLKLGTSYIDRMGFKALVMRQGNFGGGFGSFFNFTQPKEVSRESKAIKINAKKLPLKNQANSFFGAIGDFNLNHKLSSNTVKTGSPVSLFITFRGRGNISSLEEPNILIPNDLEVYEVKENVSLNALGGGEKTFEFVLIPRSKGKHVIKKYDFSYFDPNEKRYITKSIGPIEINSTGDYIAGINKQIGANNNESSVNNKNKRKNISVNKDIRYIKTKNIVAKDVLFFNMFYYLAYLIVVIVFLILILSFLFKRKTRKNIEVLRKESSEFIKKATRENNKEEMLKYFSLAIINILAFKVGMSKYAERTQEILNKYYSINKDENLIKEIRSILNLSDELRYKGKDQDINKEEIVKKVKNIIKKIDK